MAIAARRTAFAGASAKTGRDARTPRTTRRAVRRTTTRASADIMDEVGTLTVSDDQLKRERYVASNRFRVQEGKGPAFEKRWAERPSRLAKLPGFRYFTLMRRVEPPSDVATTYDEDEANYVSFTIWETKDGFDGWRKGDAFKEAHGGGTIFGFMSMLVSSLMILKGGPKPAFYDGLLSLSAAPSENSRKWQAEDGWRQIPADGKNPIDADVFVAMNRFKVRPGKEAAFEKQWAERESELKEMPGFTTFLLLRRDAVTPDDGYNYSTYTVWENRAAFDNWRATKKKPAAREGEPLFEGAPKPVFYEGVLALLDAAGA